MKTTIYSFNGMLKMSIVLLLLVVLHLSSSAQIQVYQYRQVEPGKMQEVLKREKTYWSKVAEKAMEKGNLEFWAVLTRAGGVNNVDERPNLLFVNTFKDIDKVNEVWDGTAAEVFPNVKMEDMETWSMSKVVHNFHTKPMRWVQASNVNPEEDFNYISLVYHSSNNPNQTIALEQKYWEPFIKSSMDAGKTTQKGWGNSIILSPRGGGFSPTTISYDLYPTLGEALDPTWDDEVEFPQDGLAEINALETGRGVFIWKIEHVVSAPSN